MFATYMLTDLSCDSCTQLRPNYDEEEEEDEKFKEQLQQWKKTDRDEVHNYM